MADRPAARNGAGFWGETKKISKMKIPKNLPSELFKKAAKHLKNSEQNLLTGHFSHDDYMNIEEPELRYEAIKRSN